MTWASGNGFGNQFKKGFDDFWFFTDPKEFFYSHLPVEQEWTLLDDQFNREEFYSLPATISHRLFSLGVSVVSPKNGTIEVGANNRIVFE